MQLDVETFLARTLKFFLPDSVLNRRQELLENLAQKLHRDLPQLLIEESSHILKLILLQTDQERDNALLYFSELCLFNANNISLRQVFKSCLLPLLTKLVVELGDSNLLDKVKYIQVSMKPAADLLTDL